MTPGSGMVPHDECLELAQQFERASAGHDLREVADRFSVVVSTK